MTEMEEERTWDFYREPFDLKLFLLRMLRKWYVFVLSALAGALVLGGGYFLVKVVFAPAREYQADVIFYMEYAVDPDASDSYATDYFNEYTWNEWIVCDEIQGRISRALGYEISETELAAYVSTTVPADVRLQTLSVVTSDPELSLAIARCYEEWLPEFAEGQRELDSVRVVDSPEQAYLITADVRTFRATVLGALIGLFLCCMTVWLSYLSDDRVYLPGQLKKRHGLKVFGADGQAELMENVRYGTEKLENIALVGVSGSIGCMEALAWFQSTFPQKRWEGVMGTLQFPEGASKLRSVDGVILVVEAGVDSGAVIERVLSYYRQQEISLAGAVLWNSDRRLLRRYYGTESPRRFFRGGKKGREGR
ncbi:MAG: hypothetical protein LUE87_08455 [Lachnospiraceae bacterium]|nr:hypothetical protein [Lachnospiraceae bacterium]